MSLKMVAFSLIQQDGYLFGCGAKGEGRPQQILDLPHDLGKEGFSHGIYICYSSTPSIPGVKSNCLCWSLKR